MGLTVAELARRSGADASSISNLRKGAADPGLRILRKLAVGLEIPLPEILVVAKQIDANEWDRDPTSAMPPVVQDIMTRLGNKSPLPERGKAILELHLEELIQTFDKVYANVLADLISTEGRR